MMHAPVLVMLYIFVEGHSYTSDIRYGYDGRPRTVSTITSCRLFRSFSLGPKRLAAPDVSRLEISPDTLQPPSVKYQVVGCRDQQPATVR